MSVQQAVQQRSAWRQRLGRATRHGDLPFNGIVVGASILVFVVVALMACSCGQTRARRALPSAWAFWTSTNWDPVAQQFGALPFILGTLQTSFVAILVALPISLGIAIFLAELAPEWMRTPVGFLVELLAAVPSVVYGLWGLFVFIPSAVRPLARLLADHFDFLPFFTGPVFGPSRLAASLVLAVMIIPTISAVSRDVLLAIPRSQREASLALGATQWETIWKVLIPYGLSGILGAVILGLGRALGETMAVTMVIGNNLDLSASLLHPGYTMASIIVNEFTEATYSLYQ